MTCFEVPSGLANYIASNIASEPMEVSITCTKAVYSFFSLMQSSQCEHFDLSQATEKKSADEAQDTQGKNDWYIGGNA